MNATVQSVRLFLDHAEVTWRLRVDAAPGEPVVRFDAIPPSFEHDSLRVRAWALHGDTRRALDVVELASRRSTTGLEARREAVHAELLRLDAALADLDDEETTERFGYARLERFAGACTRRFSTEWMSEGWTETLDKIRARRIAWSTARQHRELKRQALKVEKADRLNELQTLGESTNAPTEIDIGLAGDLAGETWQVEVTAATSEAHWRPEYELRFDGGSTATLTGVAVVRQSTGQAWADVPLLATTARPPRAETPPALRRLELAGAASDEDRTVISSYDEIAQLTGQNGAHATATVEHAATADVAADGRPVRVEAFTVELAAATRLEISPATGTTAVQVLTLQYTEDTVLLPGPVSVFESGRYIGSCPIGLTRPGAELTVPVGTDGRVRVDRQVHQSRPRRAAATAGTSHDFNHTTIVENLVEEELDVLVRDRTPVARGEGATVKILERPADLTIDGRTGLTEVRVHLAGHARRQLDLAYRITTGRGLGLEAPRES